MITAEQIEAAERLLSLLASTGEYPTVFYEHMDIDREGFENFIKHHLARLRDLFPGLDPRDEPILSTTMLHFYLVGVINGREEHA